MGNAYAEAAPQPLDDSLFDAAKPPTALQYSILMFDKTCVFSLNEHLFRLFTAQQSYFFREFS